MGLRETYTLIIAKKIGENKWHDPLYAEAINMSGVDKLLDNYADQIGFTVNTDELTPNVEWVGARVIWDTRVHILTEVNTVEGVTEARWV
ncbi:hypothetical protein [Weissella sp. MSCH1]|uniref:hypothetical protein n=1 Tax=Weissella sp. MSCH1 TaxID=3383343 RepID=UPI003896DB1A